MKAFNDNSISIPFTPKNVKHVNQLVQQIKANNHDPALAEKLGKAYNSALTTSTLLKITNNDLIKIKQRKKNKAKRGQAHWGDTQIITLEVVQERINALAVIKLE